MANETRRNKQANIKDQSRQRNDNEPERTSEVVLRRLFLEGESEIDVQSPTHLDRFPFV
jgi:hypothetical protein